MRTTKRLVGLFVTITILSACANTKSIYRKSSIAEGGQTEFIDAKQRAVIAVPNYKEIKTVKNADGTFSTKLIKDPKVPWYRVCAEAAPDVFSIYALGASGEIDANAEGDSTSQEGAVSLAGAFSLSTSEVGSTIERTQTINMMRESMYRTCERWLSGAVDERYVKIQAARDQRSMVAFLAIEQLTGVVKRKPTILTTQAQAALASASSELVSEREEAKKTKEAASAAAIEAKTNHETAEKTLTDLYDGQCPGIMEQKPPSTELLAGGDTKTTTTTPTPEGGTQKVVVEPVAPKNSDAPTAASVVELQEKQAACKAAKDNVATAKSNLDNKNQELTNATTELEKVESLIKSFGASIQSVSASGDGSGGADYNGRDAATIKAIADTVETITMGAFSDQSEIIFMCTDILSDSGLENTATTRQTCNEIIRNQALLNAGFQARALGIPSIEAALSNRYQTNRAQVETIVSNSKFSDKELALLGQLKDEGKACSVAQSDQHTSIKEFFENGQLVPKKVKEKFDETGAFTFTEPFIELEKACRGSS